MRSRRGLGPGGSAALLAAVVLGWLVGGCVTPAGTDRDGLRRLTYEDLYGAAAVDFDGRPVRGLTWLPDEPAYLQRMNGEMRRVDAASGEVREAYDARAFAEALAAREEFSERTAEHHARHPHQFSRDRGMALIEVGEQLYVYAFGDRTVTRLTGAARERDVVELSPTGAGVAFLQDHDLFVIDTATCTEVQLTHDGSETLLNGRLDWVYQEEVFGRGNWRGYWWSDDGAYIAYLQLDQSDVPTYPLVDYEPTHPEVRKMRYPKAGDPNPIPRLGVVPAAGGDTVWVDLSAYDPADIVVMGVGWAPDGRLIHVIRQREGLWLDLNEADPQTGVARRLRRETTPAWTTHFGLPYWLSDHTFLWRSAADGWPHLYHHARDGSVIRRITAGEWEVRQLHGVDQETGWVYFSGTRDLTREVHAYRVPLAGGAIERLTRPGYSHSVQFDPTYAYFIDTYSRVYTPPEVQLCRADGARVRMIGENPPDSLAQFALSPAEFVRVPTPRGHALNAMLLRPQDGRGHEKRPVMVFTYAGPHGTSVSNEWSGTGGMLKQLLATEGYLVWTVDPYSASGEGEISAWHAYGRLGVTELEDLEDSLRWLADHADADLTRVGIFGHSYGGYMVAYALTHSEMFKVGIAAAPLSDWRNYDTIYTEPFMRTPANNPEGYQQSSVLAAAHQLHGRLLLVHGGDDDNVHLQNTMQLIHRLQEAGRRFDVMIYPQDGHGLYGNGDHWRRLRYDYIRENL